MVAQSRSAVDQRWVDTARLVHILHVMNVNKGGKSFPIWSLVELAETDVMAGVPEGRHLLGRMFQEAAVLGGATVVLLDFAGVRVATASFLRESVAAFRSQSRRQSDGAYPVLSNVPTTVLDELKLLGEVWPVCETEPGTGRVVRSWIEGNLEAKQQQTFQLVDRHGPMDVKTLSELNPSEHVQLPAWHNRIRALVERGILVERTTGRGKTLESILKVVT